MAVIVIGAITGLLINQRNAAKVTDRVEEEKVSSEIQMAFFISSPRFSGVFGWATQPLKRMPSTTRYTC
jgi:hypothetical protein